MMRWITADHVFDGKDLLPDHDLGIEDGRVGHDLHPVVHPQPGVVVGAADALKFRDMRQTFVGGVPVILNRVSFSGELGYEIYCAPHFQLRLAGRKQDLG